MSLSAIPARNLRSSAVIGAQVRHLQSLRIAHIFWRFAVNATASKDIKARALCIAHLATNDDPVRVGFQQGSGSYSAVSTIGSSAPRHNQFAVTQTRRFFTSTINGAQGDRSTVDFAYLPLPEELASDAIEMRVPLLHNNFTPDRRGMQAIPEDHETVHRPVISTTAAETTHVSAPIAMSDMHDNISNNVDFHEIADSLDFQKAYESLQVNPEIDSVRAILKKIWEGLKDDILGKRQESSIR